VALCAFLLLPAPVGYRLDFLSLRLALLTVLRRGAYLAIAGAVVSVAGLVITLLRSKRVVPRRRAGADRDLGTLPLRLARATDSGHRDRYAESARVRRGLPRRANAPNTTDHVGEKSKRAIEISGRFDEPIVTEVNPAGPFLTTPRSITRTTTRRSDPL
jgi:hypothetical protein